MYLQAISWANNPACFIAGTLVLAKEGKKAIESIEPGDEVLAYDEQSGDMQYKKVARVFRNTTDKWYHLTVDGEEIVCTPLHPFYVLSADEKRNTVRYEGAKKGKWIAAKELKISDKLLLANGKYAIIDSIEIEVLKSPEITYNFEVEDFHTYFVGESEILVHNTCEANLGSTGRTEANNLIEKLAMEQVKSDPLNGAEVLSKIKLGDSRWLSSDGWVKMQYVVRSGSHQTTIHFVYNKALNLVDDFKFIAFKPLL